MTLTKPMKGAKRTRRTGAAHAAVLALLALVWAGLAAPPPAGAAAPAAPQPARAEPDPAVFAEGRLPRSLSALGLFLDPASQTPAEGVLPYDLATPLFTDYALKFRFVFVPPGTAARYDADQAFAFPVGTALVKTFAYPADFRQPEADLRLIETRILAHTARGWRAYPYVWRADGSDADLMPLGTHMDIAWRDAHGREVATRYLVPNMNQCKSCHVKGLGRARAMTPIGPKARHLNHDFAHADGVENQLVRWTRAGILEGAPADPATAPAAARWDDGPPPRTPALLDARARAYLDINCAHCHAPDGPAHTSGLYLGPEVTDPATLGVYKRPVAAGRGSGGLDFSIVPGDPEASILLYRMKSVDPGVMMPELGRTLVHEEGVALIRDWIASLDD